MVKSRTIIEQSMKFNKIYDDLVNIEVNIQDKEEKKTLLLLCALPISFEHFKSTILFW